MYPLIGGIMIGLASIGMLAFYGKVAGVSGVMGGLIARKKTERLWRVMFILGFLACGLVFALLVRAHVLAFRHDTGQDLRYMLAGGFLVGLGSRIGGGCTSGHGICGIGRGSMRSLIATLVFVGVAMLTVWFVNHMT